MIKLSNPAFDVLRQHKNVDDAVEDFVLKRLKGRCSNSDLITAFENGISGQYGKIYSLDAATLIGWVEQFLSRKNNSGEYRSAGLLDPRNKHFELNNSDWMREANKCLTAFLNGVSEVNFHPHVYDRMMLDGKIELNSCMKYLQDDYAEELVIAAKQKVLRDIFLTYKSKGWTDVYFGAK